MLDFEAVFIDGVFPEEIRDRVLQGVNAIFDTMDLQDMSRPAMVAGRWGELHAPSALR